MPFSEKLLEKSNSYNHYKSKSLKLSKENKELKEKVKSLEKANKDYKEDIEFLKEKIIKAEDYNRNISNEIHYALVFNDTIKESEWLKEKNFSLINAAANYSLMYYVYRVLDEVKPKNILELGLGQTTRLTSQYANHFKDSKLTVIEDDSDWIETFSEKIEGSGNIRIVQRDIEKFEFNNSENLRFKDLLDTVGDEKYDFIIIDAPHGYIREKGKARPLDYSRSNVWQLIPDHLADDFVIIMDDYERAGEQNTMEHVKELLKENKIFYYQHRNYGLKFQYALFSKNYKFLAWY